MATANHFGIKNNGTDEDYNAVQNERKIFNDNFVRKNSCIKAKNKLDFPKCVRLPAPEGQQLWAMGDDALLE